MADSLTGSQFFATYFSAQKPFLLLPIVSLHYPTLVRRRGRRKLLHIAFCSTPTSPNLDVISTHEHSDGTVLFRFGVPSEIAKEDELEEPLLGVEEGGRDSEEEISVVKVLDGDNAGHVEEIFKKKDDSEASVPPPENDFPSLEVEEEMKGQSSDESFEELDDEKSPVFGSAAAMPESSDSVNTKEVEESEGEGSSQLTENDGDKDCHDDSTRLMENGATLSEIEAADDDNEIVQQTQQISENIDPIMEEPSVSAPEGINLGDTETVVDEISPEKASEGINLVNTETVVDEISSENAPDGIDLGNTETVVDEINPENIPGGINQGNTETAVDEISPENADIRHFSMDAEDQSIEVLNFENDDQTELSNLSVVTEDQASQNSNFKNSGEPNVIEVMPDSPKLEAEPILDEEVDHSLISESNESESPLRPDETSPSIPLEVEGKDVENTEITEVSGHEVVEDQSSEVLYNSKEATSAAEELILSSGATLLQYPSKAFAGGHEAYFIACGKWLGVADGVGSWSLEGSDPGVYAQELMQNSESIVSQCDKDLINDPKQVLNLSVSKTDSPGSSTILIAHFDGKALHVANIGDSGFIVVRNGSVYRKSSPMLHEFNFPIQIEKGDDPSQLLEEYTIQLDEGDIIVTATDALFDNLYDQEIVSIVSKSLEADKSPQVPMIFLFTFSCLTFYEMVLLFSYFVGVILRGQLLLKAIMDAVNSRVKLVSGRLFTQQRKAKALAQMMT